MAIREISAELWGLFQGVMDIAIMRLVVQVKKIHGNQLYSGELA
ncbi:hypothetical protein ACA373_15025 [Erwinia sp. STN24]